MYVCQCGCVNMRASMWVCQCACVNTHAIRTHTLNARVYITNCSTAQNISILIQCTIVCVYWDHVLVLISLLFRYSTGSSVELETIEW